MFLFDINLLYIFIDRKEKDAIVGFNFSSSKNNNKKSQIETSKRKIARINITRPKGKSSLLFLKLIYQLFDLNQRNSQLPLVE